MADSTRVLLVTANIATCFEQPDDMLKFWLDQLLKGITDHQPGFFALHCQEVGGKNYQSPTNTTENFLKLLLSRPELQDYSRSLVYLDGVTAAADKFTALGNLYFIHKDAGEVQTWNFKEGSFEPVEGRHQHTGCIEDIPTKEKAKFPQEFFPECKWSRKGFMRTRWRLNGTQFDLVNIHLFHDASNFIAMKEFPSVYSLNRRRALHHTLDRFHNDTLENVPFFMFGDFNFRLDTKSVVEILTKDCTSTSTGSQLDEERRYHVATDDTSVSSCDDDVLTVSKRCLRHVRHQHVFREDNGTWMRQFDMEPSSFSARLTEMPISFPPSYPFMEEPDAPCGDDCGRVVTEQDETLDACGGECRPTQPPTGVVGHHYAHTRLPGWCDRVMISHTARGLVDQTEDSRVQYAMLGLDTPMGDHKPVSLHVSLPRDKGVVACCSPHEAVCRSFVHKPASGKDCYSPSHPWCVCRHYPTCPKDKINKKQHIRASPQNSNTGGLGKENVSNKLKSLADGKDKLVMQKSVPSKQGVRTDRKVSKTNSDGLDRGAAGTTKDNDSPSIDSAVNVFEDTKPDDSNPCATYKDTTSDCVELIIDKMVPDVVDNGVQPCVNLELMPDISVSVSCDNENPMSSYIVTNPNEAVTPSQISPVNSTTISFDVPTIITSHTSDVDGLDVVGDNATNGSSRSSSSGFNNSSGNDGSSSLGVVASSSSGSASLCVDSSNSPALLSSSSSFSSSGGDGAYLTKPTLALSSNKSDSDLVNSEGSGSDSRLEVRRFSTLSVDIGGFNERRRSSCLSVGSCSLGCGMQCACSGDEMHGDRRCSEASFLDYKVDDNEVYSQRETESRDCDDLADTDSHKETESIEVEEIVDSGNDDHINEENVSDVESQEKIKGSASKPTSAAASSSANEVVNSIHGSKESLVFGRIADSSAEPSLSFAVSETKSVDLSIQSIDSDVSFLLAGDVLSTLLRNRFKKYEKSTFDPHSDRVIDNLSVTSSMRVEYDSQLGDSQIDLSNVDSQSDIVSVDGKMDSASFPEIVDTSSIGADFDDTDDRTLLIVGKTPVCESISCVIDDKTNLDTRSLVSDNCVGASRHTTRSQSSRIEDECVSLTLSADMDDATSNGQRKNSRDIYCKLEQMRKIKRAAEPQQSLNNLLLSDSGSEHVSLHARQPSESSISAMYSEDTVSCKSRSSRKNKDYYECGSQITSEDSSSVKSRPVKDPESVSQMYASEDSTSYRHQRLAKDYESISQTPTYDIADLESITKRANNNAGKRNKKSGAGRPVGGGSKNLLRRRRVSDVSSSQSRDGRRDDNVSISSTVSTTRPALKCCCIAS